MIEVHTADIGQVKGLLSQIPAIFTTMVSVGQSKYILWNSRDYLAIRMVIQNKKQYDNSNQG
jgi:hypothetical protein